MAIKEGDTVRSTDPTPCPFCRGTLSIVESEGALCHTLPMCEPFKTMDLNEFLAVAIRRRQETLLH